MLLYQRGMSKFDFLTKFAVNDTIFAVWDTKNINSRMVDLMPVHRDSYKKNNIILIDTMQFGVPAVATAFCYYDGEKALLMDVGTSDNVETVLSTLEKEGIRPEQIVGITLTHYHFDHGGGTAELWRRIKEHNPEFRIYTTALTRDYLNNSASHLEGAQTTFGPFVGTMEPIPDDAFVIVEPEGLIPVNFKTGDQIRLYHTPGHSPDHCSPCIFKDGNPVFIFAGEAAGASHNPYKLYTSPTSMPPNFNYDIYMTSFEKIIDIRAEAVGFCHFGIVSGSEDLDFLYNDHRKFMMNFRDAVTEAFSEKQSTGYVLQKTEHLWDDRFNPDQLKRPGSKDFFTNIRLAATYGFMIGLGMRKPKYER